MTGNNRIRSAVYYCLLFFATNFVNKYVLSVLDFKYPTLFQGWQTLVGFIVLRLLVVSHQLPSLMTECSRSDTIRWFPGMILFALSVYSGSKGLANLPIPAFFALQSLSTVISYGFQVVFHQTLTSFFSYLMMMLIVVSSVMVVQTDPQFHADGYIWTGIHIAVTGLLQIYSNLTKGRLKISLTERLYCNYIYSVIIFAPSSYLLGDALEASTFPYLYFSKFWMGCILSGIFGVFLNLQTIKLQGKDIEEIDFSKILGGAKIITSLLSFFVFDAFYTANYAMWISVNLLASLVVEDPDQMHSKSPIISVQEIFVDQGTGVRNSDKDLSDHNEYPRHNVLYNDYLRDSPENSDAEDTVTYQGKKYNI